MTPTKILVAVDGGPASRAALRWIADHLGARPADVRLASVLPERPEPGATNERERVLRGSAVVLDTIAGPRDVSTALRHGDPAAELLAEARDFGAELVVIGTRASPRDEHSASRSVPGRVAAGSACPVVVVPAGWVPGGGPVVIGNSIDSASDAAAEFAVRHTEPGDGVTLVHVWDPPVTGEIPVTPGGTESIPQRQQTALDATRAEFARRHPDLTVRSELRHGSAGRELLRAAEHARLLVVGRRRRSPAVRLLTGSTSRAVLAAPPCPVAVVPAGRSGIRVAPDAAGEEI